MKLQRAKPSAAGPSSSIGIMRFFDTAATGPKLTPEFVMALSIAFVLIVLFLKWFRLF